MQTAHAPREPRLLVERDFGVVGANRQNIVDLSKPLQRIKRKRGVAWLGGISRNILRVQQHDHIPMLPHRFILLVCEVHASSKKRFEIIRVATRHTPPTNFSILRH